MRSLALIVLLLSVDARVGGQELWDSALARMPLAPGIAQLNSTNCVQACLNAFTSNAAIKALIFMPGATDQLYFFGNVRADLTNRAPSLLDAVTALTNQTLIRVAFQAPFLLLHSHEDVLNADIQVRDGPTHDRLQSARFVRHAQYQDRDWDYVQPILRHQLNLEFLPARHSTGSWHFYRFSLVGWNLTGWETVEALALAAKARVSIDRKQVRFVPDRRLN